MSQPTHQPAEQVLKAASNLPLICIGCGYDLRESDPAGTCPECGVPVENSLNHAVIRHADPAWALNIAQGCKWLRYAVLATELLIPASIVSCLFLVPLAQAGLARFWLMGLFIGVFTPSLPLIKAIHHLKTIEPGQYSNRTTGRWHKCLAVCYLILLAVTLFLIITGGYLYVNWSVGDQRDYEILGIFGVLCCLIQLLTLLVCLLFCARLLVDIARRVNDRESLSQAKWSVNFMLTSLALLASPLLGIILIILAPILNYLPLLFMIAAPLVSFVTLGLSLFQLGRAGGEIHGIITSIFAPSK